MELSPNAQKMWNRLEEYPQKHSLSDLHIRSNSPFSIRSEGQILNFEDDPVSKAEI